MAQGLTLFVIVAVVVMTYVPTATLTAWPRWVFQTFSGVYLSLAGSLLGYACCVLFDVFWGKP